MTSHAAASVHVAALHRQSVSLSPVSRLNVSLSDLVKFVLGSESLHRRTANATCSTHCMVHTAEASNCVYKINLVRCRILKTQDEKLFFTNTKVMDIGYLHQKTAMLVSTNCVVYHIVGLC